MAWLTGVLFARLDDAREPRLPPLPRDDDDVLLRDDDPRVLDCLRDDDPAEDAPRFVAVLRDPLAAPVAPLRALVPLRPELDLRAEPPVDLRLVVDFDAAPLRLEEPRPPCEPPPAPPLLLRREELPFEEVLRVRVAMCRVSVDKGTALARLWHPPERKVRAARAPSRRTRVVPDGARTRAAQSHVRNERMRCVKVTGEGSNFQRVLLRRSDAVAALCSCLHRTHVAASARHGCC